MADGAQTGGSQASSSDGDTKTDSSSELDESFGRLTLENVFRVGSLNINSIKDQKSSTILKKTQEVTNLIKKRGKEFDVFVLQETKFDDGVSSLPAALVPRGFQYARQDRLFKQGKLRLLTGTDKNVGGGQLILVRKGVEWKELSRGEIAEGCVQYLHIEITAPVHFHLIAIYNPDDDYWKHLYRIMQCYVSALKGQQVMFIGDFNVEFHALPENSEKRPFLNQLVYVNEMSLLITENTHGNSCIDQIITNIKGLTEEVMADVNLSKHKPICCTLPAPGYTRNVTADQGNTTCVKIPSADLVYVAVLTTLNEQECKNKGFQYGLQLPGKEESLYFGIKKNKDNLPDKKDLRRVELFFISSEYLLAQTGRDLLGKIFDFDLAIKYEKLLPPTKQPNSNSSN